MSRLPLAPSCLALLGGALLIGCPPLVGGEEPAPGISISPAAPTSSDGLTLIIAPAADAGFSRANWVVAWQRDGIDEPALADLDAVGADTTIRGEAWTATLVSAQTGALVSAAAVTIANAAPSFTFAVLDPTEPRSDAPISVLAGGWADADADPEGYRYDWLVDGASIGAPDAPTLEPGAYVSGQSVSVVVTPTDGLDDGAPITAAAVPVLNGAPAAPVIAITPDDPTADDDLVCAVTDTFDPDGDDLLVAITWSVGGLVYPAAVPGATGPATTTVPGDTVPAADTQVGQNWICAAVARDDELDSPVATVSAYLAAGPVPDFGLEDVNATSPRTGEVVSPRDYLQKVSGWYFGHAT